MKTDWCRRPLIAAFLVLLLGLGGCFGPTSNIAYRRDKDQVHTTATTTFKLDPDHVYRAVLRVLVSAGDVLITCRDDANRTLAVAKNFQNLRITVRPQGNAAQLTIISDPGTNVSPGTDEAIVTMQEVCSELGAPCRLPNE